MFKTTKSTIVAFISFSLLSMFVVKMTFSDTLSIIREGIVRDLQGITRKQAEIITNWMDARKKDIRVTAHDLPAYRSSVIREDKEPDFSKPLEYLTFIKKYLSLQRSFYCKSYGRDYSFNR